MDEPLLHQIHVQAHGTSTPTAKTQYESRQSRVWRDLDVDSVTTDRTRRLRNAPSFKRKFASGYLYRKTLRTQSNAKFRHTDSTLPLTTNLATDFTTKDVEGTTTSTTPFNRLRSDSIRTLITSHLPDSIKDQLIKSQATSSAPALFTNEKGIVPVGLLKQTGHGQKATTPKLIIVALLGLLLYIVVGISVFLFTSNMFKGKRTHKLVDALYFSVVTLSTIGYGDIVPATTFSKLFTCVFILIGFGFIDILLNALVTYVLDKQEEVLLGAVDQNKFNEMLRKYIIDKEKKRMRIRTKMCLALGVVVICLAIGTITVHFLEEMTWVDSFYLSVTSVTTVGYGDYAFKTTAGRCFAIVWLLASTLAVARAFLYITEYRIERRNRKMARNVLHKRLTPGDIMAADMDHDGCVSKPEYVIFKLKEMGMVEKKDIDQICEQFDHLEHANSEKITIADVIGGYANKDVIDPKDY